MRRAAVCSIIPPHVLRNIAERGEETARADAALALELSAQTRGERLAVAKMGAAVSPGEKRRTIYDAGNGRDLPGRRVRGEGDADSDDRTVNDVYDSTGKTFDFFRGCFERNSIDGRGLRLDSTVHYGVRYENALWNGRQLIFGDGDGTYFRSFTSIDVTAHEITHGITQHTCALDYYGQPGALSEHFSDVFAILVKQWQQKQTAGRSSWLIGEGLFTNKVRGKALRSLKKPGSAYDDPVLGSDPQPSHMRGYTKTRLDNGGVHINSGIPNHAFYQVATMLGGRAWETAGRIWYVTLTTKLRPQSDFQSCADATFEAAGELFGAKSAPQEAVKAGWKAVGIGVNEAVLGRAPRLKLRAPEAFQPPAPAAELPDSIPILRNGE